MENLHTTVFRDPIHGDIFLDHLQAAIIDTTLFQRLRYIRQNGLLHLVFPGAVHTRFAHSIGTMHVAHRVFKKIFQDIPISNKHYGEIKYIEAVFKAAALLHDIGHCAFSHSIENANINNKPFFLPIPDLAKKWSKEINKSDDTSPILPQSFPVSEQTKHEDIGLLMIQVLFSGYYQNVFDICKKKLHTNPKDFASDITALLTTNESLKPSKHFADCAVKVTSKISKANNIPDEKRVDDLLTILHILISGTLDVDRLDYLIRDSHHIGTPYGICDIETLINGLCLRVSDGDNQENHIVLALWSRATRALDDLLWSRYQLFSQILNCKTNVMLNAIVSDALSEAIGSCGFRLKQPKKFVDFLQFTDDHVMSSVIDTCLRESDQNNPAHRALVHRELPIYLGKIDLTGNEEKDTTTVNEHIVNLSEKMKINQSEIHTWRTESSLIKGGGMPHVIVREQKGNEYIYNLKSPGEPNIYQVFSWTEDKRLPAKIESYHFFINRQ